MSTRAVYTFTDKYGSHNVYKHHDGYPSGACEAILEALKNSWQLPRFEADEFAAAFIAANKPSAGGIRLLHSGSPRSVSPCDIQYRYEIVENAKGLRVKGYACDFWETRTAKDEKKIFDCPLSKLSEVIDSYTATTAP